MKNLFIDTNIWLSLYHFTSDDLNQFKKLKDRIGKEIKLYVPRQVKDEIIRNRESKLKDALSAFEMKPINYPAFCKGYDEYEEFSGDYKKLLARYKSWISVIREDVYAENLPADSVIKQLINRAGLIECNDCVEAAYNRYRIGNPPGKDNKYGDAINWECLLKIVPDDEDLYFISADKDYRSIMSDDKFNPFLEDEWKAKKNSRILFYTNLVTFLNEHIRDITLKTEEEKEQLILELSESGSFKTTHGIIAMLSKHSGWTDNQIEKLCQIAEDNSQVSSILYDDDVIRFYYSLLNGVKYKKLNDCATKRLLDEVYVIDHEDYPKLESDYLAEKMDAYENYYFHQ